MVLSDQKSDRFEVRRLKCCRAVGIVKLVGRDEGSDVEFAVADIARYSSQMRVCVDKANGCCHAEMRQGSMNRCMQVFAKAKVAEA